MQMRQRGDGLEFLQGADCADAHIRTFVAQRFDQRSDTRMFTDCSVWASANAGAHRVKMARIKNRTAFILILLTLFVITMQATNDERGVFHFPYYIRSLSLQKDRHAKTNSECNMGNGKSTSPDETDRPRR